MLNLFIEVIKMKMKMTLNNINWSLQFKIFNESTNRWSKWPFYRAATWSDYRVRILQATVSAPCIAFFTPPLPRHGCRQSHISLQCSAKLSAHPAQPPRLSGPWQLFLGHSAAPNHATLRPIHPTCMQNGQQNSISDTSLEKAVGLGTDTPTAKKRGTTRKYSIHRLILSLPLPKPLFTICRTDFHPFFIKLNWNPNFNMASHDLLYSLLSVYLILICHRVSLVQVTIY